MESQFDLISLYVSHERDIVQQTVVFESLCIVQSKIFQLPLSKSTN